MSAPAEVLSPPIHPSLALGAYAADLVAGARVALFGDATLSLTSELVERGARLVHVFDVDAVRAAEAGARDKRRSVVFGTLPPQAATPEEASFDLVLIPDLSFTNEPEALVRLASRLLSPEGAALIASPNREVLGGDGLGYYELYDAVRKAFRRVRMLGQARFAGYLLAEFSATEAPAAAVDTSLAGRPEPEWFVALAAQREVRLEPYAIVELPAEAAQDRFEPFKTIPAPPPRPDQQVLEAAKADAEARAQTAIAERNRALADRETARAQVRQLEQALAQERKRAGDAHAALLVRGTELAERDAEVSRLSQRLSELEEARARLEENVAQYEAEILAFEARLQEQGRLVAELRRETEKRGRLVRELVAQWMEEREEGEDRSPFAVETSEANQEGPVEAPTEAETEEAPVEAREEAEPTTEAVEVVAAEPTPPEPPAEPSLLPESAAVPTTVAEDGIGEPPVEVSRDEALSELQCKLERLAQQAAHREADLIAARWKIAALENELAEAAGRGR